MSSRLLLCLLLLAPAPCVRAQNDDLDHGTLTIYFENDLFTGTDRYYTNGVKVSWTTPDLEKFSDSAFVRPILPVLDKLPFMNEADYQRNVAISLGQNIYTPDDTEATEVLENERPYAGWLYLGLGVVWKDARVKNSLNLNLGVVGPWSLAEESQRYVHEFRHLAFPRGWDNQLRNEVGAVLNYELTWRWPYHERRVGFDYEVLPHAGAALGNVSTYANLGGEIRVGLNLPDDFGTATIGPSATTPTPVEGGQQADRARRFDIGAYVFARADGRAVARNIFLDGNTFRDSASVDRKWLVADLSAGVSVNYRNTKLTYAIVYRTEEFEGQEEGQLFGSISLNLSF